MKLKGHKDSKGMLGRYRGTCKLRCKDDELRKSWENIGKLKVHLRDIRKFRGSYEAETTRKAEGMRNLSGYNEAERM